MSNSQSVKPAQLALILTVPVVVWVAINLLLGMMLFFGADRHSSAVALLRLFDLNSENTIPTWYNSLLLAAAAVVSLFAWLRSRRAEKSTSLSWLFLGLIFLWMSMDESMAFHERTIEPLRNLFNAGGLFYWSWVIPALGVVIVLAILFVPFLRSLPKATRRVVILAGAVYVFGALVMEMIGGYFFDRFGPGVLSDCSSIIEETGEMLGVILFIAAVHHYLLGLPWEAEITARR